MKESVQMTCRHCGARLKITPDISHFACGDCGTEFVVKRGENIVSLEPIEQGIGRDTGQGIDRVAMELKLQRLERELKELAETIKAKEANYRLSYTAAAGMWALVNQLGKGPEGKRRAKAELERLRELQRRNQEEARRLRTELSSYR